MKLIFQFVWTFENKPYIISFLLSTHLLVKLFPNWLMKTGMPVGSQKCKTKLRAYHRTNIHQLSALETPITWKDEEMKKLHKMNTTFYVTDIPRSTILGLPSCSRLRIVHLNCSVQFRKYPKEGKKSNRI